MISFDLPPKLWTPPKPAIIRAASMDEVQRALLVGAFAASAVRALRATGGENYQTPSYANAGGTGDRTASVTVTTDIGTAAGSIQKLVNGNSTLDGSNAWLCSTASWIGKRIVYDFGAKKLITAMKFTHQQTGYNHGTAKFGGSNDGTNWTYYGSAVVIVSDLGPTEYTGLAANVTGYRYYCLEGVTGNANGSTWMAEHEFKIGNLV